LIRNRLCSLLLSVTLTVSGLFALPASASAPEGGPPVEVDGRKLDVGTLLIDGSTYGPARAIVTSLGAGIRWSPEANAVEATLGGDRVHLFIDAPFATINGEPVKLDKPARVVNGSTYVPVRFLAEAFGRKVVWNADLKQVEIQSPKVESIAPFAVAAAATKVMLLPAQLPDVLNLFLVNDLFGALQQADTAVTFSEWDKAAEILDSVKDLGTSDPNWLTMRGVAYDAKGDRKQGISLLKAAAPMIPEPATVHWMLAEMLLKERNVAEAQELLQFIHTVKPSQPEKKDPRDDKPTQREIELGAARSALARILANAGKTQESAAVLNALFAQGGGVATAEAN